jgi:UDP-N-acetylmuramoyl-L-alanyl-D-glutamate--2,6-diaminopimelate ligase
MILGKLCMETMRLESITRIIQPLTVRGPLTFDIEGIAYDSRQVRPNFLFVALRGQQQDGAVYIEDALRRGAVAIVSDEDRWPKRPPPTSGWRTPSGPGRNRLRLLRPPLPENRRGGHHRHQRQDHHLLHGARHPGCGGRTPGLIGTVRYEIGGRIIPATRTTPEAPDVQFMLDQMARSGCRSAVMEVSSHALDQKRTYGTDFDVGVFTNLTRDHLDYHRTMASYFAAKMHLFQGLGQLRKSATAVVNLDDPWGQQLANMGGLKARLLTYGMHEAADVRAEDVELDAKGTRFTVHTPWGSTDAHLRLLGRFNVSNALAAIASAGTLGIAPARAAAVLAGMRPVPGRLEEVANDKGIHAFVDYAHSDDALAHVLASLRELNPRRLIVVFGCGGDRDRTKRPVMGAVANRLADYAIVTSDNPRREDPQAIMDEIGAGMPHRERVEFQVDREKAIARAVEVARPGDLLLVAGKGHEIYQEFSHTVVPFDDREVLKKYLRG